MADKIFGFFMAIISLTALSVVVSNRAQTANVLTSLLGGIAKLQNAATKPVTG
jgi:hypothetical protein